MGFDIVLTVALVAIFIASPIGIICGNLFERYEKKIIKIKTALLGYLENAKNDLVSKEIEKQNSGLNNGQNQEKSYNDLIEFMRDSHFLKYAIDYDDMVNYEITLNKDINRFSILLFALIIPTLLLQGDSNAFSFGFLWLYLNLLGLGYYLIGMVKKVKISAPIAIVKTLNQ